MNPFILMQTIYPRLYLRSIVNKRGQVQQAFRVCRMKDGRRTSHDITPIPRGGYIK